MLTLHRSHTHAGLVRHIGRNRLVHDTGAVVANSPEERSAHINPMTRRFQIIQDEVTRRGMARNVSSLVNGNQGIDGAFYVNINSSDAFNRVVASSTGYAFEFDNVALTHDPISLSIHGEIPEPGILALLGLGLFAGITCSS